MKWNTKPCQQCGDVPSSPLWLTVNGSHLCLDCFNAQAERKVADKQLAEFKNYTDSPLGTQRIDDGHRASYSPLGTQRPIKRG